MTPESLRKRRKKRGITAAFVAKALGISRGHLCDIEHGRRTMSAAQEAAYLTALGL